jgi:hypothetical protein
MDGSQHVKNAKEAAERMRAELETEAFERVMGGFVRLFGEELPLLIPCVRGEKVPRKGVTWTKYTQSNLREETDAARHYLEQFKAAVTEGGNLAVKLGRESAHLLVVDFDNDDLVEPFLALHPEFRSTLRTRGSRGAAFWFYATGYYPPGVYTIEVPGVEKTGELRGGNRLATVWGKNKAGEDYARLVDAAPIRFDYGAFRWKELGWKLVKAKEGRGAVQIDWDRFNETVKDKDGGVVEGLVGRYFPGAVLAPDGEWHCANIGGDPPGEKGSFHITADGWCQDFDGSFPNTGIINTLLSPQREEATGVPLTLEEIFAAIKEDTGEDFILATSAQFEKDLAFLRTRFAYATNSDEFYFDHGAVWSAVHDSRTDLILAQDLNISGKGKGAILDLYNRIIMRECSVSVGVNIAGYPAGIHRSTTGRPFLVLESTETPAPVKGDCAQLNICSGGCSARDRPVTSTVG